MRIVACVGVKDVVELLEPMIAHLRSIGVDVIVVCDMYSTDGSAELLERYAAADDVVMFQISDREDMETWAQANLAHVRDARADWAIFLDADEFPIPASGSLKDCAGLDDADVLLLDRYNVPLTPGATARDRASQPRGAAARRRSNAAVLGGARAQPRAVVDAEQDRRSSYGPSLSDRHAHARCARHCRGRGSAAAVEVP
jgi:hypothetical protein